MEPIIIEIPWRAFRSFYQLYCIEEKIGERQEVSKQAFYSATPIPMFHSQSKEANKYKQLLHDKGLVSFYIDPDENFQAERNKDVEPIGYETKDTKIIVSPGETSKFGAAWVRSKGRCAYCGTPLSLFAQGYLGQVPDSTLKLFNCESCHGRKNKRTLEEFRFIMQNAKFKKATGVSFNYDQISYLTSIGLSQNQIGFKPFAFYFEK